MTTLAHSSRAFGQDITNKCLIENSRVTKSSNSPNLKSNKSLSITVATGNSKVMGASSENPDCLTSCEPRCSNSSNSNLCRSLCKLSEGTTNTSEICLSSTLDTPLVSKWDVKLLNDTNNDLHVIHYLNEIISNLRESESQDFNWCKFYDCDYMRNQSDVNPRIRAILVDWLIEVHHKFNLLHSTLFLALNLLDRFLSKIDVNRSKLQLVGCCCLWVASKYHEIYAPEMEDFVYISDHAFSSKELITWETKILKQLEFNLTVPTSYSYVQRYIQISNYYLKSKRERQTISNLVLLCVEYATSSYELCRTKPSLVAAASFVYACIGTKVFTKNQFIKDNIADTIGYDINSESLIDCMKIIHTLVKNLRKSKYIAILKKYSSSTYSRVARLNFSKLKIEHILNQQQSKSKSKNEK